MARAADEVVRIPAGQRLPPQDLEAERSVLGAMMLSADAMAEVVETLDPTDFYRSAHGKIYEALRTLFAHGEPVDVITAVEALRRSGVLDEVGGALYLRDLVDEVPTPAGAAHYARIVADAALRAAADRRGRRHHGRRLPGARGGRPDRRRRRAAYLRRRAPRGRGGDGGPRRTSWTQAMSDLEAIQNRESAYTGLPTGFRDLDDLMSGLQPGNLVDPGGAPGHREVLARHERGAQRRRGRASPVAMFSLEMSRYEIGMRLLCAEARVPWDRIRNKRVGPDDWTRVVAAGETLHDAPLSHRRLGQRQHRRHPGEGAADAHRPAGLSSSSSTTSS